LQPHWFQLIGIDIRDGFASRADQVVMRAAVRFHAQ
jgi:hypothetical protein